MATLLMEDLVSPPICWLTYLNGCIPNMTNQQDSTGITQNDLLVGWLVGLWGGCLPEEPPKPDGLYQ